MVERLERLFPGLAGTPYRVTSPIDDQYNCIAWAVGETKQWWWPVGEARYRYWPANISPEASLETFVAALATVGFVPTTSNLVEEGVEKRALFADATGKSTHAARQLPSGLWSSKLGFWEDIEHELLALEGEIYGTVVMFLQRSLSRNG